MARVIQEQIKRPLAEELLFGDLAKGGTCAGDVDAAGRPQPGDTPDTQSRASDPA
jgi:ATP-dependent Clp protease ATP-binding subunit ClpA